MPWPLCRARWRPIRYETLTTPLQPTQQVPLVTRRWWQTQFFLSFFPSFFLYPPISSASCPFLLLAHRSLFALDDRYGDVIDAIGFWLAGFCWRPPTKSAAPPKTGKGANIFCSSLEWAILHNIDLWVLSSFSQLFLHSSDRYWIALAIAVTSFIEAFPNYLKSLLKMDFPSLINSSRLKSIEMCRVPEPNSVIVTCIVKYRL